MAYSNFIPTVWAAAIQRELERATVFAEDCNRQYEGDVKEQGDSVRILGVGSPTIRTLARSAASGDIVGPEELEDQSITMQINQIRYFNYQIGDIDKAQAKNGLMEAFAKETSEKLANEVDKYIAGFAADENIKSLNNSAAKVTKSTVLEAIDDAVQKLRENDVSASTQLVLTAPPRFTKLVKQALISLDTDNSQRIENGKIGRYGNIIIKESNNVYTTNSGAVDNIMIRTRRAIAFVQPMTHTEAYRPDLRFADAVKGFILFDGKVVRPKEVININVKYTD